MQTVFGTVESLARTLATAFVMSESGTGKELAARAIHQLSARAPGPFVVVDCSALGAEQWEQALFGADESGGFIAEAAEGTLFLDEVCSLSFEAQSKLLRLIQHGTYRPIGSAREAAADVRIIASTNRDPLFEMREGRLREDLYYRLHFVPLRMPPVRERADDVLFLATGFLLRIAEEEGKPPVTLSAPAAEALKHYSWPGNVRQLENAMRQLVLLGQAGVIDENAVAHMTAIDAFDVLMPSASDPDVQGEGGIEALRLTEKKAIEVAIAASGGSINRAAKQLQVAPSSIYR